MTTKRKRKLRDLTPEERKVMRPTIHPPLTEGKIRVMARRARLGVCLFVRGDAPMPLENQQGAEDAGRTSPEPERRRRQRVEAV